MVCIEVVCAILERVACVILASPALEVAKAVKQDDQGGGQGGQGGRASSRDFSLYVHARAADTETKTVVQVPHMPVPIASAVQRRQHQAPKTTGAKRNRRQAPAAPNAAVSKTKRKFVVRAQQGSRALTRRGVYICSITRRG